MNAETTMTLNASGLILLPPFGPFNYYWEYSNDNRQFRRYIILNRQKVEQNVALFVSPQKVRKRKAINQTELLELRDVEHGSFLLPIRLRNPLGLLIFKHTPHFQGLKKCLMDSMQIKTKTLSTIPYYPFRGFLTTLKNFHGFNLLHGICT